jgi:hypothetical protein
MSTWRNRDYESHKSSDVRTANFHDRIDRLNPKLKQSLDDLQMDYEYRCNMLRAYPVQSESWKEYKRDFVDPISACLSKVRLQYWCMHPKTDTAGRGMFFTPDGPCDEEYEYCLDCGAVDYGRGWETTVALHETILQPA